MSPLATPSSPSVQETLRQDGEWRFRYNINAGVGECRGWHRRRDRLRLRNVVAGESRQRDRPLEAGRIRVGPRRSRRLARICDGRCR